ncbi:protein-glutamine gamma-glutamyltransferase K-like [Anneissia japonica]|uniref:protein-glutamine gamma-glutamyltransferase K-like n=1 Tax=Anneissia japonica TaxID=1529436 RepID=UPI001425652A|nr:protein-glutamine gamma-glutamyltransferase K-like [Anneissia japonica]
MGSAHFKSTVIVAPNTPVEGLNDSLKIQSYDLQYSTNQTGHRTEQYENKELVLRRGQPFKVDITLNRDYDGGKHKLSAELRWGKTPKISDGTLAILSPIAGKISETFDDWGTHVVNATGPNVSVELYVKSDSLVGGFRLALLVTDEDGQMQKMNVKDEIFVLFNPWSKDDDVYLPEDDQKQEYVLNDQGMYFYGSGKSVSGARWYLGQFEEYVLRCIFDLLKTKRAKPRSFGSPVEISRVLSALVGIIIPGSCYLNNNFLIIRYLTITSPQIEVYQHINSNDDNGVLVGNWSGDYSGGTEPTAWTGSAAIFKQYTLTKKPVKFAQCWVFANVLTTALRSLGIPARSICNTASAHDTDGNCIMDYHFDSNGKPMDWLDYDSVWNFHCWTDAWMARPDLPPGYGGWQAVDATPQERSEGVFQLGPAPLAAVKAGHVQLSFDTKFVFAEVNACKVKWKFSSDENEEIFIAIIILFNQPPVPIDIDIDSVGVLTVTKAVGKMKKEIISDQYKAPEGSTKEMLAIYTVEKHIDSVKKLVVEKKKDVEIVGTLPDDVMIGNDFELVLLVRNTSSEDRNCVLSIAGNSVYYTGVRAKEVIYELKAVDVKPLAESEYRLKLLASDYLRGLVDQANIRFDVTVVVKETNQTIIKGYDFKLKKPNIKITVPLTVPNGSTFYAKAEFTNPLPYKLQKCFFSTEGSALAGYKREMFRTIKANETVEIEVKLVAKQKTGERDIIMSFSSTELIGVTGEADIIIQ